MTLKSATLIEARHADQNLLAGCDGVATESAAAALRESGLAVQSIQLDVTSPQSIAAAAEQVAQEQGRLDILVNSAGVLPEATDGGEYEFANPATEFSRRRSRRAAAA